MAVSKKGRVQVRSGIGERQYETYRAVDMPHVGPQRRESQASNYERLARDLGAFNSALQGAGRAIDAANKRAEAQAKKLEAEKKAAEARKKRAAAYKKRSRGGGGRRKGRRTREQWLEEKRAKFELKHTIEQESGTDEKSISEDPGSSKRVLGLPNETLKAYKDLDEVKNGIGKEFDKQMAAEIKQEAIEGYKQKREDEHGEPEKVPTGQFTYEKGPKGDTIAVPVMKDAEPEFKTRDQIIMEHYQKQKHMDAAFADIPLVRRHVKFRNNMHMQARLKGLEEAEEADRHLQALKFQENTVLESIKEGHALGLNPDQIAQMTVSNGLQNAQTVSPNTTKDHIIQTTIGALAKHLKSEDIDIEAARAVTAWAQGSPDAANGVTSWLKHPKYSKKVKALVKLASKVVAKDTATKIADVAVKKYMEARADGKLPTAFKDETFTINGEEHTVSVKDQETALANAIESKALLVNGQPGVQYPEEQKIPRLVDAFIDFPFTESPALKKALTGFSVRIGETMHPNDPKFAEARRVAVEFLNKGPEGRQALARYGLPKHMIKLYEMAHMLERSGPLSDQDVIQKLNVYLEHRNTRGNVKLPKDIAAGIEGWHPRGMSKEDRDQAIEVLKMDILDEDVTPAEALTRLKQFGKNISRYNPTFNGIEYNARGLNMPVKAFEMSLEAAFPRMAKDFGLEGRAHGIKSTGNGLFVMVDKDGNWLRHQSGKLKGQTAWVTEKAVQVIGKDAADLDLYKAGKETRRIKNRTWFGWAAENLGYDEYDYKPQEEAVEKQKGEARELEKILSDAEDRQPAGGLASAFSEPGSLATDQ